MSKDWAADIAAMHDKYGTADWMETNKDDPLMMRKFMEFRLNCISEELLETRKAFSSEDASEVVDGLIDLCVFAIGTLDAFGVDTHKAWDEVLNANLNKSVGVKPGRPNPLKMPDLIKAQSWTAPDHTGNSGLIKNSKG